MRGFADEVSQSKQPQPADEIKCQLYFPKSLLYRLEIETFTHFSEAVTSPLVLQLALVITVVSRHSGAESSLTCPVSIMHCTVHYILFCDNFLSKYEL